MGSVAAELGPDGRWLLDRVLLAEFGDLETQELVQRAREGIGRILETELTDEHFRSLLCAERERLGIPDTEGPATGWPTPIALALAAMIEVPVGRWDRLVPQMVATFEVLVKYLGAIAICDVLNRTVPEPLRDMFVENLERPSLGHWAGFLRAGVKSLAGDGHPSYVPEMLGYYEKVLAKPYRQGVTRIDEFVTMRNDLAHGGLPHNDECAIVFADKFPAFVQLLLPAMFLKSYTLVGMNGQTPVIGRGRDPCEATKPIAENLVDGAVALQSPDGRESLILSPFLVYRICLFQLKEHVCHRRLFLFYSDRKNKKAVTLQDYSRGHWARDPEILGDFNRRFPLADWRHGEIGRFDSLIEERTREFVGRCKEVTEVKRWVERNECGFCLIRGAPGMGKSALMSVLSQIGSTTLEETFEDTHLVTLLRGENWPKISVIPYFIVRGEITAGPTEFLSTLLEKLGRRYDRPCVSIGTADELASELQRHLQVVSKILRERGEKLILLIDGLDESVSAEGEASAGMSLLRYIPRDVPPGVFVVLSGRRRKEVDSLSAELRKLTEMELRGLDEKDVQGLLELTISQFDVEADYVKQVTKLSEGNPLYVKLLLEALLDGQMQLNDIRSLPPSVQSFYDKILHRLGVVDRQAWAAVLMVLALAREQLSAEQVAGITGQSVDETCRTLAACAEVIAERRNVEGCTVYRVFHDSFGDFMRSHKDYASLVRELSRRILGFAARRIPDRPAEPELLKTVERLFDGAALCAGDAGPLSLLIERTSRLLTGHSLMLQNLAKRPFEELGPLVAALGRCVGAATARMAIDCLVAAADQYPAEVGRIAAEFVERPAGGRSAATAQANAQAARVALEVAVATCCLNMMAKAVRHVLLTACAAADSNVRSLAIVAVFRLVRVNDALGLDILQELARRSVWFGLIRPHRLEVFAGCALGLFFERPHDDRLARDLKQMVSDLIARVWGLKLALWLVPKVVTVLWDSVPDDYNNFNLAELKAYKKYARKHPDLVASVNEMIDFIDPTCGTYEQFAQILHRLEPEPGKPETNLSLLEPQNGEKSRDLVSCLWPFMPGSLASMSRALTGGEEALEALYESRKHLPPEHIAHQDTVYCTRIVQIGRRLAQKTPLAHSWARRTEDTLRNFMKNEHGVFRGLHEVRGLRQVYVFGGMVSGFVFLADQQGDGRLDLLEELIDWASSGQAGMLRWPETPRERQADALLMRLLELMGVESGLVNPLSRETAFFGIVCFLKHASKFDDFLWDRLATILVRMSIYTPEVVARFLEKLPSEHRNNLEVRMNRILPEEGVGSVLSNWRMEFFVASFMAEPVGKQDGLRRLWQDLLRTLLSPMSISATLRYGAQQLLQMFRRD